MWRLFGAPLLALLVVTPLVAGQAAAQRGDWRPAERRGNWDFLGSTRVSGFGIDRDDIKVGVRQGPFKRIGFVARESGLYLYAIRIKFGNGDVQQVAVREFLRAGERTRPFRLDGGARRIIGIDVAARRGRDFGRRTYIDVFGEVAGKPLQWEILGEKTVGFQVDRDVIRVGRREGRFRRISIGVRGADVQIRNIKVIFLHGPPQNIRVRRLVPAGGRTPGFDLVGGDRVIQRVQLVYRARRGRANRATVTVLGLQDRRRSGPPRR